MGRPRETAMADRARRALLVGAFVAAAFATAPSRAETTPPDPAAAQPNLPPGGPTKPGSPVVQSLIAGGQAPLEVRKRALREPVRHVAGLHRRRHAARHALERPALAGVELVAPLPRPGEPPHLVVPLLAYPLDSVAAAFTTPPPPVVCHRAPRDPDAPDPHLYRETSVVCAPDNP